MSKLYIKVKNTGARQVDDWIQILTQQNTWTNWTHVEDYLYFTAEQANSTISMQSNGDAPEVDLEYSLDGNIWLPFIVDTTTVTLLNKGDNVFLRGDNDTFATSENDYNQFVMTGKISAHNSIRSIFNSLLGDVTFEDYYACDQMFKNCTALITAPQLDITELSDICYGRMFEDCTSLIFTPNILPATELSSGCYMQMFKNCSSLTSAPILPATELNEYCYRSMFEGCTSLTSAPLLPAENLESFCYESMFKNCSSLNEIEVGFTDFSIITATLNWLDQVSETGTFTCPSSLEIDSRSSSTVPSDWTIIRK